MIPAIVITSLLFIALYFKTLSDKWKEKAQNYERIMDQLMPEINRFQKILDDDMENKVERLKKLQSLSWKELEYENTRKNDLLFLH